MISALCQPGHFAEGSGVAEPRTATHPTRSTIEALRTAGHHVLLHRRVPPGDGGIALGQIAAAAARLKAGL